MVLHGQTGVLHLVCAPVGLPSALSSIVQHIHKQVGSVPVQTRDCGWTLPISLADRFKSHHAPLLQAGHAWLSCNSEPVDLRSSTCRLPLLLSFKPRRYVRKGAGRRVRLLLQDTLEICCAVARVPPPLVVVQTAQNHAQSC